jgi:hypothetical protein
MVTSNNINYTIDFEHDSTGLFGAGPLFGLLLSDIDPVYISTLFTSTGTIYKINPLSGMSAVTTRVTVSSFTISYATTSYTLYCQGTTSNAKIKLWGTHEGVFQKEEWYTRNALEQATRDSTGKEVDSKYISVNKSYELLPGSFYAGYKAVPDRTLSTSITWTIRCRADNTSLTFTGITQNIHNQWDKFRRNIRPFVYKGSGETSGTTTYST